MSKEHLDGNLANRLSEAVPRYTSYPTAPHFRADVDHNSYTRWLGAIPQTSAVSLYVHIPFCDRLCWFCACATKQTHKYAPLKRYLGALFREIDIVTDICGDRTVVTALHFGGGSPTMLKPADLIALAGHLKQKFRFSPDAEISVEIDPNDMDGPRHEALAEIGMTRASLGVQDFDGKVQQAINRRQTYLQTESVVSAARAGGARSVNIDLLYGLPYQTVESVESTLHEVLTLTPDRIALFGYAHVPWMKKHQTMIDEASLPDTDERLRQSQHAAHLLVEAGYCAVGIDHFARPGDGLAIASRQHRLKRNFQGYTDDPADIIIGLGASAIGRLPQGFVQNMPSAGGYERMIAEGRAATVRGIELTEMDRARGWVIERLMCDFEFSQSGLRSRFGILSEPILGEARRLAANGNGGLFESTDRGFAITRKGRTFARLIASHFDAYLGRSDARHSAAV